MLFNSIEFAVFLPIVFILYWFVFQTSLFRQNLFLVFASYLFYGWWDYRFLVLILFSSLVDYYIGLYLLKEKQQSKRKAALWCSILINLGFLGVFKYYNFFLDNFIEAFTFFGYTIDDYSLNIILPLGISFYTFQTLSYSIDVYKNKLSPATNFISFAAYVCFFPQLVAGPIERASNLLPQFQKPRFFEYDKAIDGLKQVLWGLFKKVVIADTCAEYVNAIFNNTPEYSGSTMLFGAFFFTIQIYGDFSGYSDIAIGTSRLFGFNLKQNFAFPYFSRDMAEFWRRWHISLSSWLRDYIYIPLGGNQVSTIKKARNIFAIFVICGLWHGAAWTYVVYGAIQAILVLPVILIKKNRPKISNIEYTNFHSFIRDLFSVTITFSLTMFSMAFFRMDSLTHAYLYFSSMFDLNTYSIAYITNPEASGIAFPIKTFLGAVFFMTVEWVGRHGQYGLQNIDTNWNEYARYSLYLILALSILLFFGSKQEYIYFQF